MKKIFLKFMPEYNAYGISDAKIEQLTSSGDTPIIELNPTDIAKLSEVIFPDKPTVAFLMGREKGHYTIDFPYAKAIVQSGVNIRFLTYNGNLRQMEGVDGVILPGGCFDSPTEFYVSSQGLTENSPGARSMAYITTIMRAEELGIPVLGICAGAQLLGAMHGLKMNKTISSDIVHKTKKLDAHDVFINPDSWLAEIIGSGHMMVNSRHSESMLPDYESAEMKIFATAPDGIPEAWGNKEQNILCVQWHPEDFAATGNHRMQAIYNWLANAARNH